MFWKNLGWGFHSSTFLHGFSGTRNVILLLSIWYFDGDADFCVQNVWVERVYWPHRSYTLWGSYPNISYVTLDKLPSTLSPSYIFILNFAFFLLFYEIIKQIMKHHQKLDRHSYLFWVPAIIHLQGKRTLHHNPLGNCNHPCIVYIIPRPEFATQGHIWSTEKQSKWQSGMGDMRKYRGLFWFVSRLFVFLDKWRILFLILI